MWVHTYHLQREREQHVRLISPLIEVLNDRPDPAFSLISTSTYRYQGSIGLPDVHSGYGFAVGNVAAFDMGDPDAVVSPGEK